MSTPQRFFQDGLPYHIYNRGNRKENIFFTVKDYQRFLRRLNEYSDEYQVQMLSYCLMPNHFHLILMQDDDEGITKCMLSLGTSYSKYINIKYELVGRLFQERFRAKLVETDEYLLHLSRYIHLNPISDDLSALDFQLLSNSTPGVEQSKIHHQLINYPWSSYREYVSNEKGICNSECILNYFSTTNANLSYQSFVEEGIGKNNAEYILPFL